MKEFNSPEELKEFLLNTPGDTEEDLNSSPGTCYSLSWKKDHWIIRANNKKVGVVTRKDVPGSTNIQDSNLLFAMLKVLRESVKLFESDPEINPLEELNKYLAGLHEETT